MKLVKYWFLEESFNMAKRMGMKNMMKLCELLTMKTFKKGEEIHEQFEEDHLIYFIKKGHVKIGVNDDESFTLKYVLGKGQIFGESKVTHGEDSIPYSAIAMSDTVICFIEIQRMEELIELYPKLHNSIFKLSGLKFRKIERRLDEVICKDAETRIKDFIIDFVNENGDVKDFKTTAKNIFSHNDIAKLTSTSRQTVNNTISALRKEGIIAYSRQEITLVSSVDNIPDQ